MAQTADTLVLFGATGDLTQRMLLPSLFGLHIDHLLPRKLAVLGTARSDMGSDGFRSLAEAALAKYLPADRHLSGAILASDVPFPSLKLINFHELTYQPSDILKQ